MADQRIYTEKVEALVTGGASQRIYTEKVEALVTGGASQRIYTEKIEVLRSVSDYVAVSRRRPMYVNMVG